jgi:hypothetical protein
VSPADERPAPYAVAVAREGGRWVARAAGRPEVAAPTIAALLGRWRAAAGEPAAWVVAGGGERSER